MGKLEELRKERDAIKKKIYELDAILDDESITDDEYNKLESDINHLHVSLGEIDHAVMLNDVDDVSPNEWVKKFLDSFGTDSITRAISIRQCDVFKKINNGKPFKYNNMRYDVVQWDTFGNLTMRKL